MEDIEIFYRGVRIMNGGHEDPFDKIKREEDEEDSDEDKPSPSLSEQCDSFLKRLLALVQEAKDLKQHEAKYMRNKTLAFENVDLNNSADSLHLEFQELRRKVEMSYELIDFSVPRSLELLVRLDSIRRTISENVEEAADKEVVESFPTLLVSVNPLKDDFRCVICKKGFGATEEVRMATCSFHDIFHCRCITTWLKTWNHCPRCAEIFPKKGRARSARTEYYL